MSSDPIRIPIWVVVAVLVGLGYATKVWLAGLGVPDIPLCVVNTSSDTPWDILLDGKSLGRATKMSGEDPKAAVNAILSLGVHKLEARDLSGANLAQETIKVEKGSHGYLWTPLPSPDFCFLLQTSQYGNSQDFAGSEALERGGTLHAFPKMVTQWFRDNPPSVQVQSWAHSDFERALRRADCSRPEAIFKAERETSPSP
jgi:hypothetical protein